MTTVINGSSPSITFSDSTTQTTAFTTTPVINTINSQASTPLTLGINGTEAMRIDSSGNLLVGTTSQYASSKLSVSGSIASGTGWCTRAGTSGALGSNLFNIQWTGSPVLWIDSTNIGNIQVSSDYRIKRNIETQTAPALERVMALRPVTYQMADYGDLFKSGEEIKEGFIAHEVQEVIPSGAEGQKDEKSRIQSLRVDAILSVAIKAIQELNAKVEAQAKMQAEETAKQEAQVSAKQSAMAKLSALGLTEDEVKALLG